VPATDAVAKGNCKSIVVEYIACGFTTMYLTILSALLAPWSCTFKSGETPYITSDPNEHPMTCFSGNTWWAMGLMGLVTVPVCFFMADTWNRTFKVDEAVMDPTHPLFTGVIYEYWYVMIEHICRTVLAVMIAFTGHTEKQWIKVPSLLSMMSIFLVLLYAVIRFRPCNHDSVNILTIGAHVLCLWSCAMALLTVTAPDEGWVTMLWMTGAMLWICLVSVSWCKGSLRSLILGCLRWEARQGLEPWGEPERPGQGRREPLRAPLVPDQTKKQSIAPDPLTQQLGGELRQPAAPPGGQGRGGRPPPDGAIAADPLAQPYAAPEPPRGPISVQPVPQPSQAGRHPRRPSNGVGNHRAQQRIAADPLAAQHQYKAVQLPPEGYCERFPPARTMDTLYEDERASESQLNI